jgi:hypothetical protein
VVLEALLNRVEQGRERLNVALDGVIQRRWSLRLKAAGASRMSESKEEHEELIKSAGKEWRKDDERRP